MVELQVANLTVEGSNPFSRSSCSKFKRPGFYRAFLLFGLAAPLSSKPFDCPIFTAAGNDAVSLMGVCVSR